MCIIIDDLLAASTCLSLAIKVLGGLDLVTLNDSEHIVIELLVAQEPFLSLRVVIQIRFYFQYASGCGVLSRCLALTSVLIGNEVFS